MDLPDRSFDLERNGVAPLLACFAVIIISQLHSSSQLVRYDLTITFFLRSSY